MPSAPAARSSGGAEPLLPAATPRVRGVAPARDGDGDARLALACRRRCPGSNASSIASNGDRGDGR
eukprot:359416-Chlamydomonas_euryale.AAC.1